MQGKIPSEKIFVIHTNTIVTNRMSHSIEVINPVFSGRFLENALLS